jgi:hypothetical protein
MVIIIMGKIVAAEDVLCPMMTRMPLMMPYVPCILFGTPVELTRHSGSMLLAASLL